MQRQNLHDGDVMPHVCQNSVLASGAVQRSPNQGQQSLTLRFRHGSPLKRLNNQKVHSSLGCALGMLSHVQKREDVMSCRAEGAACQSSLQNTAVGPLLCRAHQSQGWFITKSMNSQVEISS